MELLWLVCAGLLAAVCLLCVKVRLLRRSMDEIGAEMEECLTEETNHLICISSRDRHARGLASRMNGQLRLLRKQRLQYQSGDRELKEAVTNISHDLRTPLTVICGYLEMLEKEEKSERAERYLAIVRGRAQAMKQLTEELFRYSVIASAGEELQLEAVDLCGALTESIAAFYAPLKERGIAPDIRMPDRPVERRLNRAALSRIFGNLLSNALKYSGGDLQIELLEDGTIRFTNTAPELDEVQVGKLFNRFFSVEAARNSTGLGLAIARTLTEQMDGDIAAAYEAGKLSVSIRFAQAEEGRSNG